MIRPPVGTGIERVKPMRINSVASSKASETHLTWETNMICRCHPWKVPVSGHSNALRNARTNDHRQCGVYLEFLSFAFAQTIGNYALRRFWCLDQSESATWESSLQRDFKVPQLWKAVCRGPIYSRTQPWTMWNWHCFILFIIDHWWLPFKAVTMTLWCLVCV